MPAKKRRPVASMTYEERLAATPCRGEHRPNDGSWWHKDGHGIELFRGCSDCAKVKRSRYRRDIGRRYAAAEPIEADY